MKNRDSLTKSLHTVTVVSRLALHLLNSGFIPSGESDTDACREALALLGWTDTENWTRNDETFAACVAKLKAMRAKAGDK